MFALLGLRTFLGLLFFQPLFLQDFNHFFHLNKLLIFLQLTFFGLWIFPTFWDVFIDAFEDVELFDILEKFLRLFEIEVVHVIEVR